MYCVFAYYPYGTGSWPCLPQGWQLAILLRVSQPPLKGPCFLMASIPYWEQVGVNLQLAPNSGESRIWYNLMIPRNSVEKTILTIFIGV